MGSWGGGGAGTVEETSAEIATAEIAMDHFKRGDVIFEPVREYFHDNMRTTDADKDYASGRVAADVNKAFDNQSKITDVTNFARGNAPGSGAHVINNGKTSVAQGKGLSVGLSDVDTQVDQLEREGSLAYTDMGRGEATDALRGLSQVAHNSSREAISDAYTDAAEDNAVVNAIGSGAGLYLANRNRGNQVNTDYDIPMRSVDFSDSGTHYWDSYDNND